MRRGQISAVLALLLLDVAWVLLVMRHRYADMVASIQRGAPMRVRPHAALGAYALMVVGLLSFCIRDGDSVTHAAARGALFGFVLYGVYDLTSAAVLDRFELSPLGLVDIAWGATVFGASAAIAAAV